MHGNAKGDGVIGTRARVRWASMHKKQGICVSVRTCTYRPRRRRRRAAYVCCYHVLIVCVNNTRVHYVGHATRRDKRVRFARVYCWYRGIGCILFCV